MLVSSKMNSHVHTFCILWVVNVTIIDTPNHLQGGIHNRLIPEIQKLHCITRDNSTVCVEWGWQVEQAVGTNTNYTPKLSLLEPVGKVAQVFSLYSELVSGVGIVGVDKVVGGETVRSNCRAAVVHCFLFGVWGGGGQGKHTRKWEKWIEKVEKIDENQTRNVSFLWTLECLLSTIHMLHITYNMSITDKVCGVWLWQPIH